MRHGDGCRGDLEWHVRYIRGAHSGYHAELRCHCEIVKITNPTVHCSCREAEDEAKAMLDERENKPVQAPKQRAKKFG